MSSKDGVRLGTLTAGAGSPLLLVHGGMGQIERWAPVWNELARRGPVCALDRRGRGSSADAASYHIEAEYDDVHAVLCTLAAEHGGPSDVFAHSYGATVAIGAAARGAPVRRLVLYEPAGPRTVSAEWLDDLGRQLGAGRTGAAMTGFLRDVLGLSLPQIDQLRNTPARYDILGVLGRTGLREASALAHLDLIAATRAVPDDVDVVLLLGEASPRWAHDTVHELAAILRQAEIVTLPGIGHEALDFAPREVLEVLKKILPQPSRAWW